MMRCYTASVVSVFLYIFAPHQFHCQRANSWSQWLVVTCDCEYLIDVFPMRYRDPGLWTSLSFVELDSWCFVRGQRPPHRHHHRCVVRYHSILILPQTILHREYGTMWKCYTHRSGRLGKEHQYLLVYNQDTTRGKDYPKKTQLPKAQCGRFNASDREIHERS